MHSIRPLIFAFLFTLILAPAQGLANPQSSDLTARGVAEFDEGRMDAAVALLRDAVKADPKDGEAHYHLGRVFMAQGKLIEAQPALEAAKRNGYPASFALGVLFYKDARYPQAEAPLRAAIKEEPGNLEARYFLGLTLFRLNRFQDAIPEFDAAAADANLTGDANFYKSLALLRSGKQEEARVLLEAVAKLGQGESATQARTLLEKMKGGKRAWRLRADLLHQTDTNVLLVQTNRAAAESFYTPAEISNRSGNRVVATLQGEVGHGFSKTFKLSGGYLGYQSYHYSNREILQRFDVSSHSVYVKGQFQSGQWMAVVPVQAGVNLLGPVAGAVETNGNKPESQLYNRNLSVAPLYLYSLSKAHAVGAGYGLMAENFDDNGGTLVLPAGSVETARSNLTHSIDGSYYFRFADKGYLSPAVGAFLSDAKGDDNIWDHKGGRAQMRSLIPILPSLSGLAGIGATLKSYSTPSPFGAVPLDEDRTDRQLDANANLQWVFKSFHAQGGVSWQRNISTIDQFDYSRAVYTLGIGAEL